MTTETIREKLKEMFSGRLFPGIDTDFDKYVVKKGLAFFPYGDGTLTTNNEIPTNCFMFLGSDFGSVEYAKGIKEKGESQNATMRNLRTEIIRKEYKDKVFMTNVFMGLRSDEKSNIKKYPAFENDDYIQLCKKFLEYQIQTVKPTRIITLGARAEKFIRKYLNDIETFNIIHPSLYHANIKRSKKFRNKRELQDYVFGALHEKKTNFFNRYRILAVPSGEDVNSDCAILSPKEVNLPNEDCIAVVTYFGKEKNWELSSTVTVWRIMKFMGEIPWMRLDSSSWTDEQINTIEKRFLDILEEGDIENIDKYFSRNIDMI